MVAPHNKQKILKKKVGENAKGSTRICELSVTTSWKAKYTCSTQCMKCCFKVKVTVNPACKCTLYMHWFSPFMGFRALSCSVVINK